MPRGQRTMESKTNIRAQKKEAIAGAASVAEASRIRTLINRHKRPPGVLTWSAEYGEDATGEPAVWVWFYYKDENGVSQQKIHELSDFVHLIRDHLLEANIGRWPYVGYRNPAMQG
jgi:hypothetical protein